jgi:prepilin peptidase CpaA
MVGTPIDAGHDFQHLFELDRSHDRDTQLVGTVGSHRKRILIMDTRTVVVLVVAVVAVISDLRTRRIPNVLTFGAALAALAYATITGGTSGLLQASTGWLLAAALFFPLFALGGMGAGDVKLLAALSAWLGPVDAIYLAVFASMAGGVVGIAVALYHGYLRQAIANVWVMLMQWRLKGLGPVPGLTLKDNRAPKLAFAIPITIGAVCTLWRH